MDISEIRNQIDDIDNNLVQLFAQRMEAAAKIADYKKQNGLPIYVPAREEEILRSVCSKVPTELADSTRVLFKTIFQLSRNYQDFRQTEADKLR